MLEYLSYKKFKKHKEEKLAKKETEDVAKSEATPGLDDAKLDGDKNPTVDEEVKNKEKGKIEEENTGHKDEDSQGEHHDSSSEHLLANTVLDPEDESFLRDLLARDDDAPPPPLPPRIYQHELDWPSDNESVNEEKPSESGGSTEGKPKGSKSGKSANRLSLLFTRHKKKDQSHEADASPADGLKPDTADVAHKEADREKKDLGRVLDRLNLSAKNNKVISQSKESSELLQKFTQVFKDLVSGVPTAYDDLTKLIEDRDGTINKLFEKLPSSLQKLVTQLPEKLTNSLAPELLAAAAESQGLKTAAEGGLKGTAKNMLMPHNLAQLVTKPGAIVGMLRAIVDVLKTRWPAFLGMNVIWSVALSLLLIVLWYCYRRGREERLLREKAGLPPDFEGDRVEELPEDPTLPAPPATSQDVPIIREPEEETSTPREPSNSNGINESANTFSESKETSITNAV